MKKSEYILGRFLQRAADGGIAAKALRWNGLLRAIRNGCKSLVCATEQALRNQTPAYGSTHEWTQAYASSRVAPQDSSPVPAKQFAGTGVFVFPKEVLLWLFIPSDGVRAAKSDSLFITQIVFCFNI